MLYKLKKGNEECGFSKKQMTFLEKHISNLNDYYEVVNMADEPKVDKEKIEKEIKELEEKKAAIDKEIEEKKKSLEAKPESEKPKEENEQEGAE